MEKRFKIDFANGSATEKTKTRTNRFLMFTDVKCLYVSTRNGIVYLTESNSEVM